MLGLAGPGLKRTRPQNWSSKLRKGYILCYLFAQVPNLPKSAGIEVPMECPLHPHNDWLLLHDKEKKPVGAGQWRCGLCNKVCSLSTPEPSLLARGRTFPKW